MISDKNAHTMKWLLRREFWEHKGSMFWAPLIVGTLLVALLGSLVTYGLMTRGIPAWVTINGQPQPHANLDTVLPENTKNMIARMATTIYMGASAPLLLVLAVVVFYYCLGALHDERRDRSILFWKSLPVSDRMTVLSKAIMATVVAPAITIVIAVAASLLLLFIASITLGVLGLNLFTMVLASPDLYLSPLRLAALLPVYVVWALPSVGWLLLVSSWAKSKPILWAVGVPVGALVAIKWINASLEGVYGLFGLTLTLEHYASDVVARILGGIVPGIWFTFQGGLSAAIHPTRNGMDLSGLVPQSYMSLAGPDAWIGVAMGVAMLYGAVRMRRWRDEG
jgi:ABC-2 type transport system permease protein